MQSRFLFHVFLVFFSGWAVCSHAVPLTDPEASATLAAKSSPSASKKSEYILAQPSADFVCPHTAKSSAIECFLDAVEHLYTVCRQVKAIELLEFGFDRTEEGPNGLKSEFCRRKQKISLPPYLEAASREAQVMSSCDAARVLNDLYVVWNTAMTGLRQYPNETEDEYRQRIAVPYFAFAAYRQQVRETLAADAGQLPIQNCPNLTTFKP